MAHDENTPFYLPIPIGSCLCCVGLSSCLVVVFREVTSVALRFGGAEPWSSGFALLVFVSVFVCLPSLFGCLPLLLLEVTSAAHRFGGEEPWSLGFGLQFIDPHSNHRPHSILGPCSAR